MTFTDTNILKIVKDSMGDRAHFFMSISTRHVDFQL